ncbi:MAG: hypothetical protein MZV64_34715 [Ignavibacteriales bacterium]|nr:hypothetical protein [Ignavibacteriales bacterium]
MLPALREKAKGVIGDIASGQRADTTSDRLGPPHLSQYARPFRAENPNSRKLWERMLENSQAKIWQGSGLEQLYTFRNIAKLADEVLADMIMADTVMHNDPELFEWFSLFLFETVAEQVFLSQNPLKMSSTTFSK